MKQIILLAAAFLTISTAARAQENQALGAQTESQTKRSPDYKAKKDAERAQKKLGLSDAQKLKWQAASLERIKANEPFKSQMKVTTDKTEKQKIAAQIKPNLKKFNDTVNGFLTADQKTKWEEMKKEKKETRRGKVKQQQESEND